jgi:hypothetical protein
MQPNTSHGTIAGFSSQGLAFDGRVKPNVAAPGVALATSEPGARYGTVSGTSAAAATVAGAGALLIQERPSLSGSSVASLLTGYADPGTSTTASGGGNLDLGASAVGELAASTTALAFGPWTGPNWSSTQTFTLTNVSSRKLAVSLSSDSSGDSSALRFTVAPYQLTLGAGQSRLVHISVTSPTTPDTSLLTGSIVIAPEGSQTLLVPWAVSFRAPATNLIVNASLDRTSFKPSDLAPAILTVRAGALDTSDGGLQIEPVLRFDLLLYTAGGRFIGRLAELHDLLPGAYSFGITGRAPTSVPLAPGNYELRLEAWPTLPANASPSRLTVKFSILK